MSAMNALPERESFSRLAADPSLRVGGGGEDGDAASRDPCPGVDGGFELEYAKEGVPICCQISAMLLRLRNSCKWS